MPHTAATRTAIREMDAGRYQRHVDRRGVARTAIASGCSASLFNCAFCSPAGRTDTLANNSQCKLAGPVIAPHLIN